MRVQIRLLQTASLVEIAQQALAHCQQIGTGLMQISDPLGAGEQTQKTYPD
jgi:hypothetical protein